MPSLNVPDFDRIRSMWDRYWARDPSQRPLVLNQVRKPGTDFSRVDSFGSNYQLMLTGRFDDALERAECTVEHTEYLGELLPCFSADHGPDQFATFLGTDLEYKPDSPDTNWAHPVVHDWESFLPLKLNQHSRILQSMLTFSRQLATRSRGRYAVSVADLHSNMDSLMALRGSQNLCMDLMTCPQQVEEAMRQVRAFYRPVYEQLYAAGNMAATGSMGWAPFWCEGKFATIQCDFICMVSPEIFRKMIMPALEEEAAYLDHCVYHLDGPGALIHLDDILSIKEIDVIQWVPGAGQKLQWEWMDVLKKCQKAGKGLQLWDIDGLERVKFICRELDRTGLGLCCWGCSRDETMRIIDWLEKNK